jgi:hypothetical protein
MKKKVLCFTLALIISLGGLCLADPGQRKNNSYWTALVLEDNSLVGSILFVPYMALQVPVNFVNGIINPEPTSRSTAPPPAHRAP